MKRREFLALLASAAAAWPLAVRAQEAGKVYRVGLLWDSPAMFPSAIEAFRRGLRERGWIEGQNILIEPRWSEGRFDRLQELAEELVRLKVDAIVAPSSIYTGAARQATSTIPIIFVSHTDPIGSGHVASLAGPGGNATGLSLLMTETNAKSLEILREAVPGLSRVAAIFDPATPSHKPGLAALESVGPALGLQVRPVAARSSAEFDSVFSGLARERADPILVLSTPLFIAGAERLAELAIQHRLPSMFGPKEHTEAGGLLSYSPDRADLWRRGAAYVDAVLKGAAPGSLPVQQPTKFELAINLKTAIGLTIPPTLLARADEVIE